jgi:hypothetical protein
MPVNHDAVAAYPVGSAAAKQLARDLSVKRMPYALSTGDTFSDVVAVDPVSGATITDVLLLGRVFHLDPADTTTAGDGVSCLVSYDGKRYKLAIGTDVLAYSVLDDTLAVPPTSPDLGDAYIVAAAATGDWAGKDGQIAVFTARQWEFITIAVGRLVYVEGRDAYAHKDAAGDLIDGFGAQSIGTNAVRVSSIIGKPVRWFIENQTTNAPPSPSIGVNYIIGPSPTGVWSGHAAQIAACEDGSTWTIYAPRAGELAYDKSLAIDYRFDGTQWASSAGAWIGLQTVFTGGGSAFIPGGNNVYGYAFDNPPITTNRRYGDLSSLTRAARVGVGRLRITYSADLKLTTAAFTGAVDTDGGIALYRDTELAAVGWYFLPNRNINHHVEVTFVIDVKDTNPHEYGIATLSAGVDGVGFIDYAPSRRTLTIEERA